MRRAFCTWIEAFAKSDPSLVFLTGDLGYAALENVAKILGERFINVGVSEQNMISVAAGLANEGFMVVCYSIAPFAVFRPAEQIRLDVCIHNKNVKIVGNGGGYGYGIMGATHHAIEDLAVLSPFPNMRCLIPQSTEDVAGACESMMASDGPCYLRLNAGSEEGLVAHQAFAPVRRIYGFDHPETVIVGLGPMALQARRALQDAKASLAIYSVTEMPLHDLGDDLVKSIASAKRLWVLEEHVSRGGLGEHLVLHLAKRGVKIPQLIHNTALGYPSGLYGSQSYHQHESGLSVQKIRDSLAAII